MGLVKLLKKYALRINRILLIRQLIDALDFDTQEKALYRASIDILDDAALDAFYQRLAILAETIEDRHAVNIGEERRRELQTASTREAEDARREPVFNILLDNL